MNTIWGKSDMTYKLAQGVVFVNTPGHGGFLFTRKAADKYLTPQAKASAEHQGNPNRSSFRYCFEEDCKAAIVLFEHPEYAKKLGIKDISDLASTISTWDADYLLARGITPEPKGYAHYLANKEEDRLRRERCPDLIVAAFGDWAEWVPDGKVGLQTADDARYIASESEYRELQYASDHSSALLLSKLKDVRPVSEVITVG